MKLKLKFLFALFIFITTRGTSQIIGPDKICYSSDVSKYGTLFFEVNCNSGIVWYFRMEGDTEGTEGFTIYDEGRDRIDFFAATRFSDIKAGIYEVEAFATSGGITCATKTITITRTDKPRVLSSNFCDGDFISKNVTGEALKWYSSNDLNPIQAPKAENKGQIFYVSNTKDNCESEIISDTVDNIVIPVLPITSNSTLCAGDNTDLAIKVTGDFIKWYPSNTATTAITKPTVPSIQGDYTYHVTNTKEGCESGKVPLSISVSARTPDPLVYDTTTCFGDEFDLSRNVKGSNIKWYYNAGSTQGLPAPTGYLQKTTTFYVTSTVGCESSKVPVTFNIVKPELPLLKTSTINYCQSAKADSVSASLTTPAAINKWYNSPTGSSAPISLVPSTKDVATYSYYVSQMVQGCESDRALLTVKINPSPRLSSGDLVLSGAGIDITSVVKDSNNAGGTFTYFSDFNLSQTLTAGAAQSISTPGIYYVKSTLGACSDVTTVRVTRANLASQNITFPNLEPRTFAITSFPLSATSSAGLPITYYSSNPAVASISNDKVNIISAGTVNITATQNGNSTTNPAINVSRILIINRAPQPITLTEAVGDKQMDSPNFDIKAGSLVSPLKYSVVSGPASVSSTGTVTVSKLTSGKVTIMVSHAGNEKYLPAEITFSFEVLSKVLESKVFPQFLTYNATTGISITPKSTYTINTVKFYYKKITQNTFDSVMFSPSGNTYLPDLTGKIDEIGIRYYFKIKYNTSLTELTDTTISYTDYAQGLTLPALGAGTKTEDYKIIAVPLLLEGKTAKDVFDELGPLDRKKWRLFHYTTKDSTNAELSETDQIMPGKGYWIISRNGGNVNTGRGTAVKVNEITPFKLELRKGYNQIGNPYNFPVNWNQVQNYNQFAGVDKLKIFTNTGWQTANTLQIFEGAYVFSNSDVNYSIPARKIDGTPLRTSSQRISDQGWILPLSLSDQSGFKSEGAVGMKPDASSSKDSYDEITMPRFFKYLELNFHHPEYFAPKFSHDIVPESDNHVWNFTMESSNSEGNLSLAWDANECKNRKGEIYLLDKKVGATVNMKEQSGYRLAAGDARSLAIYYGDPSFINSTLAPTQTYIMDPYPNPSSQGVTLNYTLAPSAGSYDVDISIYDMTMKKLSTMEEGRRNSGFYQTVWNRDNEAPGLYILKFKIISEDGSHKEWLKKVVLK